MNNKKAVLLINLGTPADISRKAVAAYLREFLMDPFVLDIPWLARYILVNAVIAPTRSKKSLELYRKVWSPEGSPLLIHSKKFAGALSGALGEEYSVHLAMRYGQPAISEQMRILRAQGFSEVLLFPLYPQYALSSTETCKVHCKKIAAKEGLQLKFVKPFYNDPGFTDAWVKRIQQTLLAKHDFVLFSYHGLPERHVVKTDVMGGHCLKGPHCCAEISEQNKNCYRAQCFYTTRAIVKELKLSETAYSTSFQSRLGRSPWIKPYTDLVIHDLVKKGVKNLLVVSPSFVADCLETVEEISFRLREDFLKLGGESLTLVPSLNDFQPWIQAARTLIQNNS